MKKKKITLTEKDLKLGPNRLMKKYGLSSRGHAHYVLQKGYFWENYLTVEENISLTWVERNFVKISKIVNYVFGMKIALWGYPKNMLSYKDDIMQDAILYICLKSGDIENGSYDIFTAAGTGVAKAIRKYCLYNEGAHETTLENWDNQTNVSDSEGINLDELCLQVKAEIVASFGEKDWNKVWSWAKSRTGKCPEDVLKILKAIAL